MALPLTSQLVQITSKRVLHNYMYAQVGIPKALDHSSQLEKPLYWMLQKSNQNSAIVDIQFSKPATTTATL